MATIDAQPCDEANHLRAILDECWGKSLEAAYQQAQNFDQPKSIYLKGLILGDGVNGGLLECWHEYGLTAKSIDRINKNFARLRFVIPKFRDCIEAIAAAMFRINPALPKPLLKVRNSMIDLEELVDPCFSVPRQDIVLPHKIGWWRDRVQEFHDPWQWTWEKLSHHLEIGWRSEGPIQVESASQNKERPRRTGPRKAMVEIWIRELIEAEGLQQVAQLSKAMLAVELERLRGEKPSETTIQRTMAWSTQIQPFKDRLDR